MNEKLISTKKLKNEESNENHDLNFNEIECNNLESPDLESIFKENFRNTIKNYSTKNLNKIEKLKNYSTYKNFETKINEIENLKIILKEKESKIYELSIENQKKNQELNIYKEIAKALELKLSFNIKFDIHEIKSILNEIQYDLAELEHDYQSQIDELKNKNEILISKNNILKITVNELLDKINKS